MFFKRKKQSPADTLKEAQQNLNTPDNSKKNTYNYSEALDWSVERTALIQKDKQLGWTVAKILGLTLVCMTIITAISVSKKEAYPFVIELDKSTGMTRVLDIRDPQNIPVNELLDKYWLKEFTLAHESYDYRTLEHDHRKVRLMSVPEVFEPYNHQFGLENKNSIQNKLLDRKKIVVDIDSVVPEGNGIATIRFTKRLVDTYTNKTEAQNSWTARVGYEYDPVLGKTEKDRLDNPFGFVVTSWRVDPITVSQVSQGVQR